MKTTIPLAILLALFAADAVAQKATSDPPLNIYRWKDQKGRIHYSDLLPPGSDVETVNLRNKPPTQTTPYSTRKAAADFPVAIYTTSNCEQLCVEARAFLANRNVPFTEIAIKTAVDQANFRQRFGSQAVVPVLTVGTISLIGFEANDWGHQLDLAGYQKK
ncbi:MAG: glutaredoxin family protein [Azoarcus sp.]|jgi:glutaredoxin|nr:glutaredoxin family protein [Azoarcus sp.]